MPSICKSTSFAKSSQAHGAIQSDVEIYLCYPVIPAKAGIQDDGARCAVPGTGLRRCDGI
jgi:hypothetical protein